MTDKVQKIREEVQKIARSINPYIPDDEGKNSEYEAGRFAMVTQIMQIIDSMQEEPKKCMHSKDDYTDEDKKALCDGCEEECKYSHSVNVPFDSKNYELIEATYYIPKGMCAIIEDDKVIIKKK